MNIAVLSKIHVSEGDPGEIIQRIKNAFSQYRLTGQAEIAFYLSATDPQDFYSLSFWYLMQDMVAARTITHAEPFRGLFKNLQSRGQQGDQLIFKLMREFRLLHLTPTASHLTLMTFPANFTQENLEKLKNILHEGAHKIPGLLGSWLGQCTGNPHLLLHRVDWASVAAEREGFSSRRIQGVITHYQRQGVKFEFASFDLQGVVQIEEEVTISSSPGGV